MSEAAKKWEEGSRTFLKFYDIFRKRLKEEGCFVSAEAGSGGTKLRWHGIKQVVQIKLARVRGEEWLAPQDTIMTWPHEFAQLVPLFEVLYWACVKQRDEALLEMDAGCEQAVQVLQNIQKKESPDE